MLAEIALLMEDPFPKIILKMRQTMPAERIRMPMNLTIETNEISMGINGAKFCSAIGEMSFQQKTAAGKPAAVI